MLVCLLRLVVVSIFIHRSDLSASQGAATLVGSSPMKNRKRLAWNVFDTFATHGGLVYNVADTAAGGKMAALMVVFLRPSDVVSSTNKTRNGVNHFT